MWACFWNHFWTPLKNGSGHFFVIFGVPKWVQKGELISVVGGHGAPWAPKSVLGPESCISRPPKVTPRSDNRLKKGAKVAEKIVPNLARRTARSGLNIYIYIYMVRVPPEIYLRMFSDLEDMIKKIEEAFDIHEGSPDE